MNKQHIMRIDVINAILRFMVIFTLLCMIIVFVTEDVGYVWKSLILFQASILSFIISKCTKHIWSYTVLHIILLMVYLLLTPDVIMRVIYCCYIIIYAIAQFAMILRSKISNTPFAFTVIFFAMYFLCNYKYKAEAMFGQFFFFFTIAFGLLYIVNRHLINLYYYLKKHEDKANIPLKQINKSNNIFVAVFLVLCCIVMAIFTKLPIGGLLRGIGIILRNFLRFLFMRIGNSPTEQTEEVQPQEETMLQYLGDIETPEPSAFWLKFSQGLMYVSYVIFIVLFIALIVYGLYRIYRMYYQKKVIISGDEKVEVISPFTKNDLGFFGNRRSIRKSLRNLFVGSNNDRIRKQYLKAVQKHAEPEKELKYFMPTELSGYAVLTDNKQMEESNKNAKVAVLTNIYEKARYSNEECSKEEVQSVKNILK